MIIFDLEDILDIHGKDHGILVPRRIHREQREGMNVHTVSEADSEWNHAVVKAVALHNMWVLCSADVRFSCKLTDTPHRLQEDIRL